MYLYCFSRVVSVIHPDYPAIYRTQPKDLSNLVPYYACMTAYTMDDIRAKRAYYGEFMLVLESDREYDFHNFTTTFGDEEDAEGLQDNEIRVEGMKDGDYLSVDIPVGRIEHVYGHREA